jgi:hypothetical protein
MDVDKITAIAALIETGKRHEQLGDQRDAVKAYAEAYQGMQETLVEVHTLWVEAYQELTRQTGPEFESTIPFAAQEASEEEALTTAENVEETTGLESDTLTLSLEKEPLQVSSPEDEAQDEQEIEETASDDYQVFQVAKDDVDDGGLGFKSSRSNPFTQAAKDLAAAVVEAASDVAAAVVDVRRGKSFSSLNLEEKIDEPIPHIEADERLEVADSQSLESTTEEASEGDLALNVYEHNSDDHKLVVLESLLQQVRSRRNP